MNSSLQKALIASLLAIGASSSALGQVVTPPTLAGFDYDPHCVDPNNTAPYSAGFITYHMETPMMEAGIGASGTVAWKFCDPVTGKGGSVTVAGRLAFKTGLENSIQDDLRFKEGLFDVGSDDGIDMNYGSNSREDPDPLSQLFWDTYGTFGAQSGAGWSFARVYYSTVGGTTNSFLFGGPFTAFEGASNRYAYLDMESNNIEARCVLDVIADAARVSWTLTNHTGNAENLGLWFGQWVVPTGGTVDTDSNGNLLPDTDWGLYLGYVGNPQAQPIDQELQPYIILPGQRPIVVDQRFIAASDPTNFPAWCDFSGVETDAAFIEAFAPQDLGLSPQVGGGMQIVNAPYANVQDELGQSDQTPVDEFDIGDVDFLMSGRSIGNSNPTFNDITFNDAFFSTNACFVQKWQPALVPNGQSRNIVTYYRSIWGDSSYSNGYSAVVDPPKVISLSDQESQNTAKPVQYYIQVNVDNTGGFGLVNTPVAMNNVKVILQLSQGMAAFGNPTQTTITQVIPVVGPNAVASTDFHIQVSPTIFGEIPYSVTIEPGGGTGATKVINGAINVAATPTLLIRQGANLVTSPWVLTNDTWESVLAPLQPEIDYQAYIWDPVAQEYAIQASPQRGIGTWIVSQADHGFLTLGGNPAQPTDEFPPSLGAPNVSLAAGWNLVANPYNYGIQLGQLLGVPLNTTTTVSYDDMVSEGIFDGSFAYYQQDLQTYNFLDGGSEYLLPNYGYWVFMNEPITLVFPPVFDMFARSQPKSATFQQGYDHWKLQLSASATGVKDLNNFVGLDTTPGEAVKMQVKKAPMSPAVSNAIRAFVSTSAVAATASQGAGNRATATSQFAQLMHTTAGKQVYSYNVFTTRPGPVTLTWPNLAAVPDNLEVLVTDLETKKTVNARSSAGYTYMAPRQTMRNFQVTISPQGTIRESIGQVTTKVTNLGSTKQMTISYNLSTKGIVNMFVYQGSTHIGTVVVDQSANGGSNTIVWPMTLLNGQMIQPGSYTLEISATGEGGDTANKLVGFSF